MSRSLHILFLSDNFPPEANAPATRLYEHARYWVQQGHQVTVITCAPNFPEGRLFPGYRNRWYHVSDFDGIRVVRVKTYITANQGFIRRTLDYLSFMVSGVLAGLFQRRPDLIVATSPQFFCALGGWLLAVIRRKPFVFELRDLWPASIVAVGAMQRGRLIRWLERLELFLYRQADAIIPVTESFKTDLIGRGIDPGKIQVVINGVDLDRYSPRPPDRQLVEQYGWQGKFVVGYLGTHGLAHGLDSVLTAARRLKDRTDIVFVMIGTGARRQQLVQDVADQQLTNVIMLPLQPKHMMPRWWSICTVTLIPLRDNPVFATVIPSKLFEAMGMNIPVVMSLPEGEATALVQHYRVGEVVPPEHPQALAECLVRLSQTPRQIEQYRRHCQSAAGRFSRARQAAAMLAVFQHVVGDGNP